MKTKYENYSISVRFLTERIWEFSGFILIFEHLSSTQSTQLFHLFSFITIIISSMTGKNNYE